MALPLYVVDAFTPTPFGGNQAAVVLLEEPADEAWMLDVAKEMRHSETAFVLSPNADGVRGLRWFTPGREVELCGHATLATAHTLWDAGLLANNELARFDTLSGILTCTRNADGSIAMDFPAPTEQEAEPPAGLLEALGVEAVSVRETSNSNWIVELADAAAVRACSPDFDALLGVSSTHAFCITAASDDDHDVIVRYFAPAWGINEDPATGSLQTNIAVHWADRLGAKTTTVQAGPRPASLAAELRGDRVIVSGQAVTVVRGELDA